jgi:hypothetical protein
MSIGKKILSIILSISLIMGMAALCTDAISTETSAGVQATTSQWWQGLPGWVQWILRWLIFGWIWMKPITPQIQPLVPETVAHNLMRAVETRDVGLFEAQLCLNIKQNVADLPGKIGELLDSIDGEFVDYTWKKSGDYYERRNDGRSISHTILQIDFTTTVGSYRLLGGLEYHNNFKPEEMGMRSILLFDPPTATTPMAEIRATEETWHD